MEENAEFYDLYSKHISAAFTLLGVLLGVIISSIVNWKIKSKEARLRILEKVFDRRLDAHEDFLRIPKLLRTSISKKEVDHHNFIKTYPGILADKEIFENFQGEFFEKVNFNSHWFENELQKEVWLAQEYIQSINNLTVKIPDERWLQFAEIIKPDLLMFSNILEQKTTDFLKLDITQIKNRKDSEKFEYSLEERQKILEQTELHLRRKEIYNLMTET